MRLLKRHCIKHFGYISGTFVVKKASFYLPSACNE